MDDKPFFMDYERFLRDDECFFYDDEPFFMDDEPFLCDEERFLRDGLISIVCSPKSQISSLISQITNHKLYFVSS